MEVFLAILVLLCGFIGGSIGGYIQIYQRFVAVLGISERVKNKTVTIGVNDLFPTKKGKFREGHTYKVLVNDKKDSGTSSNHADGEGQGTTGNT